MPFHDQGNIRYYTFDLFDKAGLRHAVLSRRGGVSPAPWASLNVGATVGDPLPNVQENRRRSFEALGKDIASMHDSWLVHGTDYICVQEPRPADSEPRKADILLTDREHVTLYMRYADCVPILLCDPARRVVAIAHAGWIGTVKRVPAAAVCAMQAHYGCRPRDILAVIGPSICQEHYPVGSEVVERVHESHGDRADALFAWQDGQAHLDLWQANRQTLIDTGVKAIEVCGICTACHPEDWYSHRAEHGRTGRFGALMALS